MPVVSRPRHTWAPEKDEKLMAYYKHGLRASYIAQQMGLTVASVESGYRKLKRAAA